MEIKYSNTEPDRKVFEKNYIYGLYDKNSNYIQKRIANIETLKYNEHSKVGTYLRTFFKGNSLLKTIKEELTITKELEKKRLNELSTYELALILLTKVLTNTKSKVIILDNLDIFLTSSDLNTLMLHIKNLIKSIDKTIILNANKIDNIILTTSNYIIVSENRIIYSGNNIDSMHETTDIIKFVKAANEKGAKLSYYKDAKDLLKAIYRSVKK